MGVSTAKELLTRQYWYDSATAAAECNPLNWVV